MAKVVISNTKTSHFVAAILQILSHCNYYCPPTKLREGNVLSGVWAPLHRVPQTWTHCTAILGHRNSLYITTSYMGPHCTTPTHPKTWNLTPWSWHLVATVRSGRYASYSIACFLIRKKFIASRFSFGSTVVSACWEYTLSITIVPKINNMTKVLAPTVAEITAKKKYENVK